MGERERAICARPGTTHGCSAQAVPQRLSRARRREEPIRAHLAAPLPLSLSSFNRVIEYISDTRCPLNS
eukprot:scaffold153148_cov40-Tisochrysis_lutea.AAC.1